MLLKTIMFDAKSRNWANDQGYNFEFLRITEGFVNDIIRHRGYMYLNQICECLGVEWNPEDENPCTRYDGVNRIAFVQFEVFAKPNNSFLVNIIRYD